MSSEWWNEYQSWLIIVSVLIVWIIGAILFYSLKSTPGSWYNHAPKSPHQPPGWVFSVVWTIIYVTFAVTWVWIRTDWSSNLVNFDWVNVTFIISLILNLLWSIMWYAGMVGLSLMVIMLLWTDLIVALVVLCAISADEGAKDSYIMAIVVIAFYACWITFATYLNWYVYHYRQHKRPVRGCPKRR